MKVLYLGIRRWKPMFFPGIPQPIIFASVGLLFSVSHAQLLSSNGTASVPQHCLASSSYSHTCPSIKKLWNFGWSHNKYSHISNTSSHVYLILLHISRHKVPEVLMIPFFIYIILQKNFLSNITSIIDGLNDHFNWNHVGFLKSSHSNGL